MVRVRNLSELSTLLAENLGISNRPDQRASNTALLLGLLYVVLEGPYVGILPPLPFIVLFSSLLGIGIVSWALDRFEISENEWGIRDTLTLAVLISLPTLYWRYSNKFLGMSSDYLAKMATAITCKAGTIGCVEGAQLNLAYYPMGKMVLVFGGFILLLFLL